MKVRDGKLYVVEICSTESLIRCTHMCAYINL